MNNTPQETITQDRINFENKFSNYYLGKYDETGDYINTGTAGAWEGWQACAQLTRERQAKSGETVAITKEVFEIIGYLVSMASIYDETHAKHYASKLDNLLSIAAPQQAIPSGWKLVPDTADSAMMNKGAGLLQELQSKMSVTRSLQDICRLVYEVMLEASPNAPIESDK
jgi:hypothetical protein